jgi:hypothetical protein
MMSNQLVSVKDMIAEVAAMVLAETGCHTLGELNAKLVGQELANYRRFDAYIQDHGDGTVSMKRPARAYRAGKGA